jgi:hypothetical protein
MIPCHVHGNHWVAVTRRIINDKIFFFYADDMNNTPTEGLIKEQLQSFTNNEFYPPDATWVRCHNTTYHPHSNECGPRTLFALTIMGLHPNPNENMLLPYMSGNLAQLSRYWVAATIVLGTPLFRPLTRLICSIVVILQLIARPTVQLVGPTPPIMKRIHLSTAIQYYNRTPYRIKHSPGTHQIDH